MFKHPSSTSPIVLALLLSFSLTVQSFPVTQSRIVFPVGTNPVPTNLGRTNLDQPVSPPQQSPQKTEAQKGPAPAAAPVITATLQDSGWPTYNAADEPNPLPASTGDTVTYTAVISNTGTADAMGVNFNDIINANTSTLFGVPTLSSVLVGDVYSSIGNVGIDSTKLTGCPSPNTCHSVTQNDSITGGETLTKYAAAQATLISGGGTNIDGILTVTTTNSGTVLMNTDGTFTYNPAAGFTGADSFFYAVNGATGIATAQVTITVTTPIWFIQAGSGGTHVGTLANPFSDLKGAAGTFSNVNDGGAGHPKDNDNVFMYNGSYTGGLTLRNGQKLIGEGASATLASIAGVTPSTESNTLPSTGGTSPVVTTVAASTNGINIGVGFSNTLRGFTIGNTTGAKIASGASFGTLTVGNNALPDMVLSGSGQALNLISGAFAATSGFTSVASTSSGTTGITLNGITGTVSMGSTTITTATNQGIFVTNTSANIDFGNTSVGVGGAIGAEGVRLDTNTTGTRTFGTLTIANVGTFGFVGTGASGGGNATINGAASISSVNSGIVMQGQAVGTTMNFTAGANVTTTGAGNAGILTSSSNVGTLTFSALTVQTNAGAGMNLSSGGIINVTNATGTINNTVQAASAIIANGVQLNANFSAINSSGGTNGVSLTTVTGTSNFGSGSLSGASGATFLVNGTTETVTYNGTITQGNAARVVDIQNKTGGTITLGGAISSTGGTGTGIILNSNAGATINFTGAISLTTNANAAFTATSSGTISANNATSTITTTTGQGLNITSTNVGAAGLTFASITSTSGQVANITTSTGTKSLGNISTSSGGTTALNLSSAGTVNVGSTVASSLTTSTAACVVLNATILNLVGTGAGAGLGVTTTGLLATGVSVTGGTVDITGGGLVITTSASSGQGLVATSGGTITVQGSNNTISSGTGTALNVANTTIGASGLTFRSISSNGSVSGIILNNTGANAGLTVTGNSAGNCGGSITVQPLGTPSTANAPVTADCTGGTIQNTTGYGVTLTNTKNVSLTRMLIENVANGFDEINAQTINGLTIDHSYITDNAGNAGDRGIEIGDFSTGTAVNGTITVSNSTIGTTPHDNIGIGIGSGTSTWSFTNDVLTGSVLDSGMNFEVRNATVTSFLMDGCVVQNQFADGMQINPASGVSATITTATIQNSTFVTNNIHIDLNHDGTSNVTYKVLNNTFRTSTAQAVNFFTSASAGTGGTANGRFVNNRIGTVGTSLSGGGAGFRINVNGGAAAKVLLDSNVIRQEPNGRGIEIISRNGTGGTDATVTNNDVDTNFVSTPQNGGFSLSNIFLQSNCLSTCNTLRSNVTGNTVPAVAPTGELVAGQIVLIKTGASTNQLVDNPPASPDAASELASHNTGSTATSGSPTLIAGPIGTPPLLLAKGGIESVFDSQSELFSFLSPSVAGINPEASVARGAVLSSPSVTTTLNQQQLDSIVAAAIERWSATGLSQQQITTLRGIKFGVTDLADEYLGEAEDNRILVDRNAEGKGWFVDPNPLSDTSFAHAVSGSRLYTDPSSAPAGHVDLLTAIEHEMGHKLGLLDSYSPRDRDSLMYGYLTVGERRLPTRALAAMANGVSAGKHFLSLRAEGDLAKAQDPAPAKPVASIPDKNSISPSSGGTVNQSIGTLSTGSSVTIIFQVTINNAQPLPHLNISNQGTVSGTNFSNVLTDDPNTGAANDPTLTPLVQPTASNGTVSGTILDNNGNPVEGAVVNLSGTQNRKFITDSNGHYSFDNVEANGFYTVVPSRVNYLFSPAQRSFSLLGNNTDAAFTASMTSGTALNPLDTTEYFVRQHYLDFLGREPDESGFNFWSDQILACNSDAACVERKRSDVSAAFFFSIEFQQTGYLVYRMYQAAYGDMPGAPVPVKFGEFKPDTAKIANGVVVLKSGWESLLESNKQAFATEFVQRNRFLSLYGNVNDVQFVDTLNQNAGFVLSQSERDQLVSDLSSTNKTRAQVLRSVAENPALAQQQFNQAFVLMQYFGYLRRDANSGPDKDFSGYNFWLNKLITFNGNFRDAEMVKAFLVSTEYRGRFPK
jgi:hypothetical protein